MNYYDWNQEEAKEHLRREELVALLPIGAIEVHGDHLPLDTDCCLAVEIAKKIEAKLGSDRCAIMPCVPYTQVWSLRDVPGSIHVPDDVLSAYLFEIAKSLDRAGVRRMAVVNAHMGNNNAIKAMARKAFEELQIKVYSFTYPKANPVIDQVCTSNRPHKVLFHADEIETSYMLYLAPERVVMEKAISQNIVFPEDYEYTPARWSEFMEKAVLGDATAATAEKGKAIIDAVVDHIAAILKGAE